MTTRPLCKCGNLAAINYKKNNKTYYRSKCAKCIKLSKLPTSEPWEDIGYIKKMKCEKCGFVAKTKTQIKVIPVEMQYKSVCLNCAAEITALGRWKGSTLTPDF